MLSKGNLLRTGQPYEVLRVGHFFFIPWQEKSPRKLYWWVKPNIWRTPHGKKWDTAKIRRFAHKIGKEVRAEFFLPKLIDEDENRAVDTILYG